MDILNEIKSGVNIGDVVNRLGLSLQNRSENTLLGNCPTGHPSQSGQCFGVNLGSNYYNCFSCGEAGDVVGLVQIEKDYDFKTALNWLAGEFMPHLKADINKYESKNDPVKKEQYQKAGFYQLIYEYGKELLYMPEGQEALSYLVNDRGYDIDALKETDWIYFPPDSQIRKHLLESHPESEAQVKALKLQGYYGDNFRLAFPYRDRHGRITTYIKRSLDPCGVSITRGDKKHEGVRYDSTPGQGTKYDLFNLCNCKGKDTIIIVEGYPDALYFQTLGLDNVVAVGQGLLSKTHLEGLQEFGVKNVIIAFDNDTPKLDSKKGCEVITGVENTDKAIKMLAGTKIKSFVLPPSSLAPHKDPDEYVNGKDIDAFRELISNAISGAKWRAYRVLEQNDAVTDLGRESTLQKAISEACGMSLLDRQQFLDIIEPKLALSGEYLEECMEEFKKDEEEKRLEKEYKALVSKTDAMIRDRQFDEIGNLWQHSKQAEVQGLDRTIPLYSMEEFYEDILQTPDGLKTGYTCLDNMLRIPNDAITIVAGRPSHGKTTFMLNMFLNMVEAYPDKSFLFLTYEEPKKHILLKLLNILSGDLIDSNNNLKNIERYIKGGNTSRRRIEEGKAKLNEYLESGRLWIVDKYSNAFEIEETLKEFSSDHEIGAVFIDYIQKIPSSGKFGTRQLELQHTSGQILETAKSLSIPIILGAQLGRDKDRKSESRVRLENLREAGDIEQDANLVLGIHNQAMADSLSEGEALTDEVVNLDIHVLKNRNGTPMVKRTLAFNRPILRIEEAKGHDWLH